MVQKCLHLCGERRNYFHWEKLSLHICKEEKGSKSLFLHTCMTLLGTTTPLRITLKSLREFNLMSKLKLKVQV